MGPVLVFDPSIFVCAGGISFIGNVLMFRVVSPLVSKLMSSKYDQLSNTIKSDWNSRFTSNINAIVSMILSSYTLYYDNEMGKDTVWANTYLARVMCSVIVGYMFADIVCMVLWCKIPLGELIGYGFHHAATVYAYFFVSVYGVLCYFAMVRLLAEMSTPFVNQRWYFDVLEVPRSRIIVVANGLLMVVSFFLFRIVTMPIFWYTIWVASERPDLEPLGHIQLVMYIPSFVLDSLNIYWFHKSIKGFVKAVRHLQKSSKSDTKSKQF